MTKIKIKSFNADEVTYQTYFYNKLFGENNNIHTNSSDNGINEIEKINIKLLVVDIKIIKYLMNINN